MAQCSTKQKTYKNEKIEMLYNNKVSMCAHTQVKSTYKSIGRLKQCTTYRAQQNVHFNAVLL